MIFFSLQLIWSPKPKDITSFLTTLYDILGIILWYTRNNILVFSFSIYIACLYPILHTSRDTRRVGLAAHSVPLAATYRARCSAWRATAVCCAMLFSASSSASCSSTTCSCHSSRVSMPSLVGWRRTRPQMLPRLRASRRLPPDIALNDSLTSHNHDALSALLI